MSRAAVPLALALAGTLVAWSAPARPDAASSDLVHVLDADGRSHVLQHTVATDGATLALELPGSVVPQRVLFIGAERERWAALHAGRPGRVSIGSGGALVRYRHQYGDEVVDAGDGRFTLLARSVPESLTIEPDADGGVPDLEAVTAWVFPADASVDAWRAGDADAAGGDDGSGDGSDGRGPARTAPGTWSFEGQRADVVPARAPPRSTLEIEYRLPVDAKARPAAARSVIEGRESGRRRGDGHRRRRRCRDVRDVCLREPARADRRTGRTTPDATAVAGLGCRRTDGRLVLRSIGFPTGAHAPGPAPRAGRWTGWPRRAGGGRRRLGDRRPTTDGEGPASRNPRAVGCAPRRVRCATT